MRTEVTKRERSPYAIRSLSPLIIGGDDGVWPIAGAAAPKVKPPANAAPLLRNSLRAGRFEPMSLSPSQMSLPGNRFPAGRKYMPVPECNRAQSGALPALLTAQCPCWPLACHGDSDSWQERNTDSYGERHTNTTRKRGRIVTWVNYQGE